MQRVLLSVGGCSVLAALCLALPATAQPARPAAPPARSNVPEREPVAPAQLPEPSASPKMPDVTTATYGDWILRCQYASATRQCEMFQTVQAQEPTRPVAVLAVGRDAPSSPYRLVLQVPVNITVEGGIKIEVGAPSMSLNAVYRRCTASGCYADVVLNDDTRKRLRAIADKGQIQFVDATQRDITLQFSMRGFQAAIDALESAPANK